MNLFWSMWDSVTYDLIVANLDQARTALIEAKTTGQTKAVVGSAAAAELYARRQHLGEEAEQYARELKFDAERKLGDLLKDAPKNKGARLSGKGIGGPIVEPPSDTPTLKELGLDKKQSARAQKLASLKEGVFEAVKAGVRTLTSAMRELRHEDKRAQPLPSGKYRVVYADPPWSYGNKGFDDYGHAERHYPSMSTADLCALPVRSLADDDAVLFLWVTSPMLTECFEVIKAWGFSYKTSFV